jgi:hypothetical protein
MPLRSSWAGAAQTRSTPEQPVLFPAAGIQNAKKATTMALRTRFRVASGSNRALNQLDGVPFDVDVKWPAWRIREYLSPPIGLINSEPSS